MLDRECQLLGLQPSGRSHQAIERHTQRVRGWFGAEAGDHAATGVGMIDRDLQLLDELAVDGFDDLAQGVEQVTPGVRRLVLLVATWHGQQRDVAVVVQRRNQRRADGAFVAHDHEVVLGAEQFGADDDIGDIGWSPLDVANDAAPR